MLGGVGIAHAPEAVADARPNLKSPFSCGQVWFARTYAGHPRFAVDWNLPGSGEADFGKPVLAGGSGVATVGQNAGYGNMVTIDHGGGWKSLYAHLSAITVATGQTVTNLTVIGRVGRTGRSDGSHLHQEQTLNGVRQPVVLDGVAIAASLSSRKASYQSANCAARTPQPKDFRHSAVATRPLPLTLHSGEWRNWQTRRIQVPVSVRMWGFKSPLAHNNQAGSSSSPEIS